MKKTQGISNRSDRMKRRTNTVQTPSNMPELPSTFMMKVRIQDLCCYIFPQNYNAPSLQFLANNACIHVEYKGKKILIKMN